MFNSAAIAAAVEGSPMSNGEGGTVRGRVLLADGDGLAYYCAGNDDTAPGQARINLLDKLASAKRASGSESVRIVATASGSHKGHRYAVARVKPYQGQRSSDRRPKNWQYLRELMQMPEQLGIPVEFTSIAEADDLFARYSTRSDNYVIYTQDKDMRMVPGWHLDWLTHLMFKLEAGTWARVHNEKLWGRAWFWSQMLHGDAADYIPGLPFYTDGSVNKSGDNKGKLKEIRCGEKSTAVTEMLPQVNSDLGASLLLQGLYRTCYGERWLVEMLEQAVLLWMRSDPISDPFDVCSKGNPFEHLANHADFPAAHAEIAQRIQDAINATTQDHGSGNDTGDAADAAGGPVCTLPAAYQAGAGCAGPRPLDGAGAGSAAPLVQCATRQGGEQLQAVRSAEPAGFPSWGRALLAKARV